MHSSIVWMRWADTRRGYCFRRRPLFVGEFANRKNRREHAKHTNFAFNQFQSSSPYCICFPLLMAITWHQIFKSWAVGWSGGMWLWSEKSKVMIVPLWPPIYLPAKYRTVVNKSKTRKNVRDLILISWYFVVLFAEICQNYGHKIATILCISLMHGNCS